MGEPIAEYGKLIGLCGHTGTVWVKALIDSIGHLQIDLVDSGGADLKDLADILANLLTELEAKLEPGDLNLDAQDDLQVDVKTLPGDGLQLRRGDHVVVDYDAVPGNVSIHTLVSVSGQGVLEWLEFASDHSSSYFTVKLDGDFVHVIDVTVPATYSTIRAARIDTGNKESSLFKISVYDVETTAYGIFLKRSLWFNSGLIITYVAGNDTAKVCLDLGYHLF